MIRNFPTMQETEKEITYLHYSKIREWFEQSNVILEDQNYNATLELLQIEIIFARSYFDNEIFLLLPKDVLEAANRSDMTYSDAQKVVFYLEQSLSRGVFGFRKTETLQIWKNLLKIWEIRNFHLNHSFQCLETLIDIDGLQVKRKLCTAEQTLRSIENR